MVMQARDRAYQGIVVVCPSIGRRRGEETMHLRQHGLQISPEPTRRRRRNSSNWKYKPSRRSTLAEAGACNPEERSCFLISTSFTLRTIMATTETTLSIQKTKTAEERPVVWPMDSSHPTFQTQLIDRTARVYISSTEEGSQITCHGLSPGMQSKHDRRTSF